MPDATPRNRRAQRAMSSRDLSRVVALSCKASELQDKDHYARAVEKYSAAIVAAQDLAQEDCLVVTNLQLFHQISLRQYAETPGVAAEEACAAKEQESQSLLAAMATLERRREAGTLLPGACRKWPEEEWYGHVQQHRVALNKQPAFTPEELAQLVPFVGYDSYLCAATDATAAWVYEPKAMSEIQAFVSFAIHAIDLFEQPRAQISFSPSLPSEIALTSCMQVASEAFGPLEERNPRLPAPIVELLNRWQRFESSGVLQERDLVAAAAHSVSVVSACFVASRARLAAAESTLRCCSLSSCGARELHPSHYKQCGACKTVAYCCREHQLEDWPAHKAACKAARKAAAEEAGGAA